MCLEVVYKIHNLIVIYVIKSQFTSIQVTKLIDVIQDSFIYTFM